MTVQHALNTTTDRQASTDRRVPLSIEPTISRALDGLLEMRHDDGHWAFELEADATIPAEYVMLKHFLDEIDAPDHVELERRIARYLREIQADHGGWPLFHGGAFNISASVKAYFALKMIGDAIDAPHMVRAREAILAYGGAQRCNVFTRIMLALFGEVPWRAVPVMPIEIMNLPRWFPFHLSKVSYWSRTVMVPLLVLMSKKPRARNPRDIHVAELFVTPPDQVKSWFGGKQRSAWGHVFNILDRIIRPIEPFFPQAGREKAIVKAVEFVTERLNGEDGLGAIFPAMANAVMMFDLLGYPADHPDVLIAKRSIEKLLIIEDDRAYCQPCLSPIWDTGLVAHALAEVGDSGRPAMEKAAEWLSQRQILDVVGDWADRRPGVRPGGWAFQYNNAHYPDTDDTAMVVMALDRADPVKHKTAIDRGAEWILGVQSTNGGWGAFDADNTHYYLNHIPFADHGALLDPPTADVTARCLGMLAQLGYDKTHPAVARAIQYLLDEQEDDGSWFGRWGTNYIYGTWSVLCALNAAGVPHDAPQMRKASAWLKSKQREDGGWGEDGDSYEDNAPRGVGTISTPSQTAWALLGLMAIGEVDSSEVASGIAYLTRTQNMQGLWDERSFTAVGFPRVFYLRYHGYRAFFPLWSLARYRNLTQSNSKTVQFGM